MIQRERLLTVVDNSGARIVQCIGIPGTNNPKTAYVGDRIVVAVKSLRKSAVNAAQLAVGGRKTKKGGLRVKKGAVLKALVVRAKKAGDAQCSFEDNAVILRNAKGEPMGSRIVGPRSTSLLYQKKRWKAVARGSSLLDR